MRRVRGIVACLRALMAQRLPTIAKIVNRERWGTQEQIFSKAAAPLGGGFVRYRRSVSYSNLVQEVNDRGGIQGSWLNIFSAKFSSIMG